MLEFPLLIAQIDTAQDETTGDFYYRTYAPGIGMAECGEVYVLNLTYAHRRREAIIREADVLVLNNICCPDLLPLIRDRRGEGKLTVYELCDDLNDVPPESPIYGFYRNPENTLLLKRMARTCDAMQFSSPELQRKYGFLHPVSHVFPNQILEIPPERNNDGKKEIIIGWGGSLGHLEDMAKIAEPLSRWLESRNGVRLHLMCGEAIRGLFRKLPDHLKKWTPPGSLNDYHKFLSTLEIGIAPLKDTPFNRSRSDVKFIEYASHAVIPVVQDSGPYSAVVRNGRTGFLYNTPAELISILDRLASDPQLRGRVSAGTRDYVLNERLQKPHAAKRVELYRSLLASNPARRWPEDSAGSQFSRFSSLEGAELCGRHALLRAARFELLMTAGMHAANSGDISRAESMFTEAAGIERLDYSPHFSLACLSPEPLESLQESIRLNPKSIKTWLFMGDLAARRGELPRAMECYKTAMDVFPGYELPYIRMSALLRNMGNSDQADVLLREAKRLASLRF
jgi:hypothetical protein